LILLAVVDRNSSLAAVSTVHVMGVYTFGTVCSCWIVFDAIVSEDSTDTVVSIQPIEEVTLLASVLVRVDLTVVDSIVRVGGALPIIIHEVPRLTFQTCVGILVFFTMGDVERETIIVHFT
jgi:hypothetical protein